MRFVGNAPRGRQPVVPNVPFAQRAERMRSRGTENEKALQQPLIDTLAVKDMLTSIESLHKAHRSFIQLGSKRI